MWVKFHMEDIGLSRRSVMNSLEVLQSRWGLDIRTKGRGHSDGCQWLLAGEWFGKVYIDYVSSKSS